MRPILIVLLILLTSCQTKSASSDILILRGKALVKGGFYLANQYDDRRFYSIAWQSKQETFIKEMVSKHGFDEKQLRYVLTNTNQLDWIIKTMDNQAPKGKDSNISNGAWIRYKNKFITDKNIQRGLDFWAAHQKTLEKAYQEYGIPPEIIVGIIGVETKWGRHTGKTRVIDALATLSFAYPRRDAYFQKELEQFLLMSREQGIDPFSVTGSYAGAMGYGQFMPSAYKNHAVDFNQDKLIDLWDPQDAIGSVANYLYRYNWQKDKPVAFKIEGQNLTLNTGFKTQYSPSFLAKQGFKLPEQKIEHSYVSLLRLDMGDRFQFYLGLTNFHVITRYNHSTHYAMVVWQLAEKIKQAKYNMK